MRTFGGGLPLEAATDVALCVVTRPAFGRFLVNHPTVEHEMLKAKLDELNAVREWAAIVNRHSSMQRLASLPYVFAKRPIIPNPNADAWSSRFIHMPLIRGDIAEILYLT
ncbi:MAG: hypothetical protein KUA37_13950 [Desulfomicrobium sp.]|uniref:hypothetical protein n=1 Tax=Hoeflea sp. TaxID=1940281 RepID=UPI0025C58A94|nr:hypothetical protein [Hoeflea sp.]MBU4528053.1 hypothetical protein [Alphaproteobacteria bacterium]MBV1713087.1 hypothetical protein [Desulfomicrobium sp.]MBU4543378.1 hypothetical protein [Alphaproteobacteria bacterium]MBU4550067.1 hypothetical protein [Alphaproteobacteria bacterium]MBV1785456.1 hypothetical protein [Hoeflea sp.]